MLGVDFSKLGIHYKSSAQPDFEVAIVGIKRRGIYEL